mmetsp:Transcript_36306/g.87332  ORF Transcript_36306/g.87332 Transcript_36306/m.87332 type:complete len:333 (+) Transcript_36306:40-1038(+)
MVVRMPMPVSKAAEPAGATLRRWIGWPEGGTVGMLLSRMWRAMGEQCQRRQRPGGDLEGAHRPPVPQAPVPSGGYRPATAAEEGIPVPSGAPTDPFAAAAVAESKRERIQLQSTKSSECTTATSNQAPAIVTPPPLMPEAPRMPMPPSKMQQLAFAMPRPSSKSNEEGHKMPMISSKALDHEVLLKGPEKHDEAAHKNAPSSTWMDVLRTEASLRLSENYLGQTRLYFDAGLAPPQTLDEEAERQALVAHGFDGDDPAVVETYRRVARELPVRQREEIFFLKANDKLFRPGAIQVGHKLKGDMIPIRSGLPVSFQSLVCQNKRTVLVASTST